MKRAARWVVVAGALALAGCLSDENDETAGVGAAGGAEGGQGAAGDAAAGTGGAGGDVTAPEGCEIPTEGIGTTDGAVFDAAVELKDCDGNAIVLGDLMCGKALTLVEIGSGWCQPCIDTAEKLEEEIVGPFAPKGLQVISILFEDANTAPATTAFCSQWTSDFGLTSPVLIDPEFKLNPYFVDVSSSTPVVLLVDEDFRIVYKRTGESPKDLVQTIDQLLSK